MSNVIDIDAMRSGSISSQLIAVTFTMDKFALTSCEGLEIRLRSSVSWIRLGPAYAAWALAISLAQTPNARAIWDDRIGLLGSFAVFQASADHVETAYVTATIPPTLQQFPAQCCSLALRQTVEEAFYVVSGAGAPAAATVAQVIPTKGLPIIAARTTEGGWCRQKWSVPHHSWMATDEQVLNDAQLCELGLATFITPRNDGHVSNEPVCDTCGTTKGKHTFSFIASTCKCNCTFFGTCASGGARLSQRENNAQLAAGAAQAFKCPF
jgi:hypothetical protein